MRTTAMSTPLSRSGRSSMSRRDGLAHRYVAPLDRAVSRSVSEVDSSRTVGSGTRHSYRTRFRIVLLTLEGWRIVGGATRRAAARWGGLRARSRNAIPLLVGYIGNAVVGDHRSPRLRHAAEHVQAGTEGTRDLAVALGIPTLVVRS